MKKIIFIQIMICFFANMAMSSTYTGAVRQPLSNKPIEGVDVWVYQQSLVLQKLKTNQFGEFKIFQKKGIYTLKIKFADGFEIIKQITIGKDTYAVFYSKEGSNPLLSKNRKTVTSKDMKSELYEAKEGMPSSISSKAMSMDMTSPMDKSGVPSGVPNPKAGLLTAGEINDFQKWNLWDDITKIEFSQHKTTWKMNPLFRYTAQVTNETNNPMVDIVVKLMAKNKSILWETHTDNTGKAELWYDIFSDSGKQLISHIEVLYNNIKYTVNTPKPFSNGINFIQLPVVCNAINTVDIAFVVDATGSMGDEIQYLKEELKDVIGKAQAQNNQLKINTGAVFYKDLGDDYLTKLHDFDSDINLTQKFINEQFAGGGGDFPESLDEALAVAIREMHWQSQARARILFLVLDAPPHTDINIINRMHDLIKEANQKGIRIIPVASSGIDKSTEFLLRSLSLATNGTYTFLTDHSGIGNAHLAPSTDSFKVELINDLLIRLIQQYTYIPACNYTAKKDTNALNNENPYNMYDVTDNIKVYPNPTADKCYVEMPQGTEKVFLADLSGKLLNEIQLVEQRKIELSLAQYPVGIYFIRCKKQEIWITEKLVVSR